jgi:hypothetical protein
MAGESEVSTELPRELAKGSKVYDKYNIGGAWSVRRVKKIRDNCAAFTMVKIKVVPIQPSQCNVFHGDAPNFDLLCIADHTVNMKG